MIIASNSKTKNSNVIYIKYYFYPCCS